MSNINGDKARQHKRNRKQSKQRVANQSLRDMFVLPLKTTLTPKIAPRSQKAAKTEGKPKRAAAK